MPLQIKAVVEFYERCFGNKPLLKDDDREPLAAGCAVIELLNIGGSWGYTPGIAKGFWWAPSGHAVECQAETPVELVGLVRSRVGCILVCGARKHGQE